LLGEARRRSERCCWEEEEVYALRLLKTRRWDAD